MDPITGAILAALAAGVISGATEVGKKVIVDAYEALKAALKKKHGEDSDVVEAVKSLEKKPESEARQGLVAEEVAAVKATEDSELTQLAQALLAAIKETPQGAEIVGKYNIQIEGGQVGVIGDNTHIEGGLHFGAVSRPPSNPESPNPQS